MSNEQTVADLRAARALIEKGWTRGKARRDGRYCLMGAVEKVTLFHYGQVRRALEVTVGDSPTAWNDAQPSKRPVLAAIDATIARLEASA